MNHISLESRKLSIIEYLAELQDESILQQIENLLKPKIDFWDELSEGQQAIIKKGLEDLERGDRTSFKDFLAQQRSPKK